VSATVLQTNVLKSGKGCMDKLLKSSSDSTAEQKQLFETYKEQELFDGLDMQSTPVWEL
jgi:hypothetical protein